MSKSKLTEAAWMRQRAEFAKADERKDRERAEAVIAAARAVAAAYNGGRMSLGSAPDAVRALDTLSAAVADLDKAGR